MNPTPSRRFSLQFANACLAKLLPWLSPHAERIEVAGSIRRKRDSIGDIDLVVIPRTAAISDLFGNPTGTRNLFAEEVRKTCLERGWPLVKDGPQYLVFESIGVQVDIWFGTPREFRHTLDVPHRLERAQHLARLRRLEAGRPLAPT